MGVPSLASIAFHEVTNVTTSASEGADKVWIAKTLINWNTVNRNDRVIFRMENKSWDFYFLNIVQTTCCVVICSCTLEVFVHFNREFFIEISPSFNSLKLLVVQIVELNHFLVHLFLSFRLHVWISNNEISSKLNSEIPFISLASHQINREPYIKWIVHRDHGFQWEATRLLPSIFHHQITSH